MKYQELNNLIYRVVDRVVGTQLSRIPNTEFPAIIRENFNFEIPRYPFISYDIRDMGNKYRDPIEEGFNSNGDWEVVVVKRVAVRFCCRGKLEECRSITSTLYDAFQLETLRSQINQQLPEVSFNSILDIKDIQQQIGTQWVSESNFTVLFDYIQAVIDPFIQPIEDVDIHTCVYTNQDSPDFCFDITAPQQTNNDLTGN